MQEEAINVRKKRDYRKRKHSKHSVQASREHTTVQSTHYNDIDVLHTDAYSSEDDAFSPVKFFNPI